MRFSVATLALGLVLNAQALSLQGQEVSVDARDDHIARAHDLDARAEMRRRQPRVVVRGYLPLPLSNCLTH